MKGGYGEGREIKTDGDGDGDGEGGGEVSARDERWKEWGGRELKWEGETEGGREAGGGEEERDREGQTMNSGKKGARTFKL